MSEPVFAVVGHPNKGKSSIVATLAQDDSVAIGPDPGTTIRCRWYPLTVDGQLLYTLVDTPGFQRARKVLGWMRNRLQAGAAPEGLVRLFVQEPGNAQDFPDECELLSPLAAGAGILYVVDGSVPYGAEYEAEMEILKLCNRPAMALINPIGAADYIEEWRTALLEFFPTVQVFNAHMADFWKRLDLLHSLENMHEPWKEQLAAAVRSLESDRVGRRGRSARAVAETLRELCRLSLEKSVSPDANLEFEKEALRGRYQEAVTEAERRLRDRIQSLYDLTALQRREDAFILFEETQLMSQASWEIFGLGKRDIAALGAVSGGAVGGVLDASTGGATFLLGAALGGGIGAVAALIAGKKAAEIRVFETPLGRTRLRIGPTRNVQFPFVVLNRARLHHALVAGRSHAERGPLDLAATELSLPELSLAQQRELERQFRAIGQGEPEYEILDHLTQLVETVLEKDEQYTRN